MVYNGYLALGIELCGMVRGVLMLDVVNVICGLVALVIVASGLGDLLGEILRGEE